MWFRGRHRRQLHAGELMLDNDKQIAAFGILSAQGFTTPAPVISYREAISLAKKLELEIDELYLQDATYPATVSAYTDKLPGYVSTLANATSAANSFISAIEDYTSPSELLQMKIGWECYAKGNRLDPVPGFALVDGLQDTDVCSSMSEKLELVTLAALSDAMKPINEKVKAATAAAAPAADGAAATAPLSPPTFTPAEIAALKLATDELEPLFSAIAATSQLTSDYTDRVNSSTATAQQSLSDAVSVTLAAGLITDPVMSKAIAAIMPDGAIEALKE